MPLSEHVCCVAITFKMTAQVRQWICIRFCIKLDYSSVETIWMIEKAAAMGKWWLAATAYAFFLLQSFLVKHQITQVTQPPNSPNLAPCDHWLFPKLKSPFKGKRFPSIDEIQENPKGQLMAVGRTVWGPKVLWRGRRCHYPMYNTCIFNKCLYFSYYMTLYILDRQIRYRQMVNIDID